MEDNITNNIANNIQQKGLLKNRSFRLLWASGLLCSLAFSIFFLSQSWYVVDELKIPHFLGPIMVVTAVPRIIMMIVGGVVADYYRRSSILFITNLLQAFAAGGMVLFLLGGNLTATNLLIFAFFFGLLDAFFWPAGNAMLPSIINEEDLVRANSIIQGSNQLAFIVGPVIAGFILVRYSYSVSFTVVGIFIALAAILIHPRFVKDPDIAKRTEYKVLADFKEGIRYILKLPVLLYCTIVAIILNLFIFGSLIISFPLFIDLLGGTALDLSYIETAFATGSFLAGAAFAILNPRKHRGRLMIYSLLTTSIFLLVFSRITFIWQGVVLAGLMGLTAFAIIIPIMSIVQEQTDYDKLGRVTGIITIAFMGLEPVAYALISVALYLQAPLSAIILTCGILATVSSLWLLIKHHSSSRILDV